MNQRGPQKKYYIKWAKNQPNRFLVGTNALRLYEIENKVLPISFSSHDKPSEAPSTMRTPGMEFDKILNS